MKLSSIAKHFDVDLFHYSHFIRSFSPFGPGERWEQPIVRAGTTRKLGFIAAGTDVPVPAGPAWDTTVAEVADTAIEDMLMDEIASLAVVQLEHMHLQGFGAVDLEQPGIAGGQRHSFTTPATPNDVLKLPDEELLMWLDAMRRELDERRFPSNSASTSSTSSTCIKYFVFRIIILHQLLRISCPEESPRYLIIATYGPMRMRPQSPSHRPHRPLRFRPRLQRRHQLDLRRDRNYFAVYCRRAPPVHMQWPASQAAATAICLPCLLHLPTSRLSQRCGRPRSVYPREYPRACAVPAVRAAERVSM